MTYSILNNFVIGKWLYTVNIISRFESRIMALIPTSPFRIFALEFT